MKVSQKVNDSTNVSLSAKSRLLNLMGLTEKDIPLSLREQFGYSKKNSIQLDAVHDTTHKTPFFRTDPLLHHKFERYFFTPKFFLFFTLIFLHHNFYFFLHQNFWFFTPKFLLFFTPKSLLFLHQIFKFRKRFFGKNSCKKAKKIGVKMYRKFTIFPNLWYKSGYIL